MTFKTIQYVDIIVNMIIITRSKIDTGAGRVMDAVNRALGDFDRPHFNDRKRDFFYFFSKSIPDE